MSTPNPAGVSMRDEADAPNQRADKGQSADEGRPADERHPADEGSAGWRGGPPDRTADWPADATIQFRAVSEPPGAIPELADATMQFRVFSDPAGVIRRPADATMQFHALASRPSAIRELADATMQFRAVSQLGDATMTFRFVSELSDETDGLADVNGFLGQAELQALIRSILADMKPREREVIELSFRHDLVTTILPSCSACHRAARTPWLHAPVSG